jgi:Fe2+ or Zn2+ uptake regulation protein
MDTHRLDQALRDAGHRNTRPRRAVWRVLDAASDHLTVEQIHAAHPAEGPEVARATRYPRGLINN